MAIFTVLNTNDFGAGSLRDSIAQAEANGAGEDTIVFSNALSGQIIRLTSGELVISAGTVVIDGDINNDGIADVTISGDKTGNGLSADDTSLLNVAAAATVSIKSVTLSEGRAVGANGSYDSPRGSNAAIISNSGVLNLVGCYITENYAAGGDGAFYNFANGADGGQATIIQNNNILNIADSLFAANKAYGGSGGFGMNDGSAGNGAHASIIHNLGTAALQNVGFNTTIGGIRGGRGGNGSDGTVGRDGGFGGHESNIINSGLLSGELVQIGTAASQANSGGYGGLSLNQMFPDGDDGLAGLFSATFLNISSGTAPGFTEHAVGTRILSDQPNQILNGTAGVNTIFGFGGADIINGLDGNDDLAGGHGNDTISGGNGDDIVEGGFGNDTLTGGAHAAVGDTMSFAGLLRISGTNGVVVDLSKTTVQNTLVGSDTISGFENVIGSRYGDLILESAVRNTIRTGDGEDEIRHNSGFADVAGEIFDGGSDLDTLIFGGTGGLLHDLSNDALVSIERLVLESPTGSQTRKIKMDADLVGGGLASSAIVVFDSASGSAQLEFVMGSDTTMDLSSFIFHGSGVSRLTVLVTGDATGESINGSVRDDTIVGNGGSDVLSGFQGNDTLIGGDGNDILSGANGEDRLIGGAGGDTLYGDSGIDDVADYSTSTAAVTVNLNLGGLQSGGHAAGDFLSDIEDLIGSDFNDKLTGDDQVNRLDGGAGDDTIAGGITGDEIIGGAGLHDIADYSASDSGVTVGLNTGGTVTGGHATGDMLSGIEDITGSVFADTLTGNSARNILRGGDGGDSLNASNNNDELYGGNGDDTLVGGAGVDIVNGGAGTDTASYSTSGARIVASLVNNTATGSGHGTGDTLVSIENLTGSAFNDFLTGSNAVNFLIGSGGNDLLYGGGNADTLNGGSGDDTLIGGTGNDVLIGGAAADTFVYDSLTFNNDSIIGWQNGSDKIDLFVAGLDFADFTKTQDGADTVLTLNGSNTIRLVGINANTIDATDFV